MRYKLFGPEEYLILVTYKSGQSITSWFTEFKITPGPGASKTFGWKDSRKESGPLLFGADEVESVWMLDCRKPLFGGK